MYMDGRIPYVATALELTHRTPDQRGDDMRGAEEQCEVDRCLYLALN